MTYETMSNASKNRYHSARGGRCVEQDRYHPCPACEYCTREKIPDRCTCFRQCVKYRTWLARTWRAVTAPLLRD
ncbi:MAG: hypothetical protein IJW40_03105 [Clostridia bacterium]|nr:hypothetical protein [Clostridia bacterium]